MSDYLYWFLQYATPTIQQLGSGTTFPELSKARAREIPILIPPLAEQQRIVAAIEEHLSRLDAAEALLRRVEVRAPVVVDSELSREIDEAGWSTVRLIDIAEFVTDGDHNPPPRVSAGIPHLTAKNVRRGGLSFAGCTFVSPEGYEQTRRRYEPRPGDVLVTCVGTIGESAVVPEGAVFSADRNLAAIRPTGRCDSAYLRLVLSTPQRRRSMAMASGSTAQPHLYLRDLRALPIPLPPFAEQRRIVREAEATQVRIRRLAAAAEQGQERSSRLRRSILRAAFRGELVAQDATDEAAILLLERIAAERTASSAAARKRRVRTQA